MLCAEDIDIDTIIEKVETLPFRMCVKTELGRGENARVLSVVPLGVDWEESESSEWGVGESDVTESYVTGSDGTGSDGTDSDGTESHEIDDPEVQMEVEGGECMDRPSKLMEKKRENEEGEGESDKAAQIGDDDAVQDIDDEAQDSDADTRVGSLGEVETRSSSPVPVLRVPTVMGEVEAVVKAFDTPDQKWPWVVRAGNSSGRPDSAALALASELGPVLFVADTQEDAARWIAKQVIRQSLPSRYAIQLTQRYETANEFLTDEFTNEVLINHLVTKALVHPQLSPHFVQFLGAYTHADNGYMLMERVQASLDDLFDHEEIEPEWASSLQAVHIAALMFQIVFAVSTMQAVLRLKHHDLHLGNVMIKRVDESTMFRGAYVKDATHFHYHVHGQNFYLPNGGLLIKIADFGTASATAGGKRVGRLDMPLFNDDVDAWGVWDLHLDGQYGYDLQVLMSTCPFGQDSPFRQDDALMSFMRRMARIIMKGGARVSRSERRPLPGKVSNIPPMDVLKRVFAKPREKWYDFRDEPPTHGRIITMGDSKWFDGV